MESIVFEKHYPELSRKLNFIERAQERILAKVESLEKELARVREHTEQGFERNDNHITFVTRMYLMFRNPIAKLLQGQGWENYLDYDKNGKDKKNKLENAPKKGVTRL